ncbi:DUF2478 domain-containing protein [Bradyrhizobium tropiciagri]|uniref:DUF2478 domain-containing protein n=1 Tax=Bradyrhizobium tropiciagri TaxID=312253 RepID=UPI001BA5EAE0|nr:DUF2478 domain-containing protein [Bradyrhizobium tropiciagri]MBR0899005.1 DUF2478 domain-containing protein [Bradyrhizobium tropiciagri]
MDTITNPCRTLAAVVYDEGAYPDNVFMEVVVRCRSSGVALAGIVQRRLGSTGHRCDMLLVNLATREQTSIFADRGRRSKGCQLNENAMLQVVAQIGQDLSQGPKLLVLNKFGKVEVERAGMRELIAQAVYDAVSVVIGVPRRNLAAWREFAGDLSIELHGSLDVHDWLSRAICRSATVERNNRPVVGTSLDGSPRKRQEQL